ncbi:MAG: hypothetical protein RLZZ131_960, partial [Actinomycetota bacterium]
GETEGVTEGIAAGAGFATTGVVGTAAAGAETAELDPIEASRAPTGTVWSTATSIEIKVPATGEGISVSTLSVETSNSGSSTATESPTDFNQRVTVPSVTDSPRAGIDTTVAPATDAEVGAGVVEGDDVVVGGVAATAGAGVDAGVDAGAGALAAGVVAAGDVAGVAFAESIRASSAPTATV